MRVVACLALLLLGALPALAQNVGEKAPLVKGTKVRLRAPKGFEPASRYSGYELRQDAASIMVSELPGPFAKTQRDLTKEKLASRGMTLAKRESVKLGAHAAVLLELSQTAAGTEFHKWMLTLGDERNTVLIVATWPAALDERHRDTLRKSVLGARWDTAASVADAVPFEVGKSKLLTYRKTVVNALVLVRDKAAFGNSTPADPMFVAAPSIGAAIALDRREAAAKKALGSLASLKELEVETKRVVTLAGLRGWEHVANAKSGGGASVVVFQAMVFDDGGYFRMFGTCAAADRETYLPEFHRLARTFKARNRE